MSATPKRRATFVVLVLVGLLVLRAATEGAPRLDIKRTLGAEVSVAGTPPSLSWPREGQAAVEVDGLGGPGTSGGSEPVPIASVAKVMTAYLTLRAHPLGPGQQGFSMTVSTANVAEERQRASQLQSVLAVRAGETISERQALQALLLPSANNVAAMLAVHESGSIAAFVEAMNATAKTLGMRATTYTDPSGFDDSTISTAYDQLLLARAAIAEPALGEIAAQATAALPVAGQISNLDSLVGVDGYVGLKTGSDRAAGGCFVFAKRTTVAGQTLTILGVVLGQRQGSLITAALAAARRLGDSVAATLHPETVLPAGTQVLSVRSPDGRQTDVVTADALSEVGWGGLRLPAEVHVAHIGSAIHAGANLARIVVGGRLDTPATARGSIGPPSLWWRLLHPF